MAIVPPDYMISVVSIGESDHTGNERWFGTGFFAKTINDDGSAIPYLITNKHVFEDKDSVIIRMNKKGSKNFYVVPVGLIENGKKLYHIHNDPKIDIAVLPLNGKFIMDNQLEFIGFDIINNAYSSTELRNNGIDEGNIVYMLGFPMGFVNVSSTSPICRMGCIARIDESQIKEQNNILVDIQNFPGNSGSPIVSRAEMFSIEGTPHSTKSVLVGIVHSYIPYRESLMNTQTKEIVEIRSENSGLANVHPVELIREIILSIPK